MGSVNAMFRKADPSFLMDEEDRKTFDNLPEKMIVYRGAGSKSAGVKKSSVLDAESQNG